MDNTIDLQQDSFGIKSFSQKIKPQQKYKYQKQWGWWVFIVIASLLLTANALLLWKCSTIQYHDSKYLYKNLNEEKNLVQNEALSQFSPLIQEANILKTKKAILENAQANFTITPEQAAYFGLSASNSMIQNLIYLRLNIQNITATMLSQKNALVQKNTTLTKEFLGKVQNLKNRKEEVDNNSKEISYYCIGSFVVHFLAALVLAGILTMWKINGFQTKKKYGAVFLSAFFLNSSVALVFSFVSNLIQLGQVTDLEYGSNEWRMVLWGCAMLYIFGINAVLITLCIRLRRRLIVTAEQQINDNSLKESAKSVKEQQLIFVYFMFFIFIGVYALSIGSTTMRAFSADGVYKGPINTLLIIIVYILWLIILTVQSGISSFLLSDALINLRCGLFYMAFLCFIALYDRFQDKNTMIGAVGYQYATQAFLVLFLIDFMFECVYIVKRDCSQIADCTRVETAGACTVAELGLTYQQISKKIDSEINIIHQDKNENSDDEKINVI